MHRSNKLAFANIWQLVLDVIFLIISYIYSYFIICNITDLNSIDSYLWILIVFIPVWLLSMGTLGMYDKTTFNYTDRILRNVFVSSLLSGVILAAMVYFVKAAMFSRLFYATFLISGLITLAAERYLCVLIWKKYRHKSSKKVIIIGASEIAVQFKYYIKKTNINIDILGYVHVEGDKPHKSKKNFGKIEDLEEILKQNVIDEVIFALPKHYLGEVEKYVLLCEEMGLVVRILLDLYDLKISKTHLACIGPIPMLTFHSISLNRIQLTIKRSMDIAGSVVGLLITGFFSIFIIPALKINSKGPIFFSQDRVGLNGRVFKVYKFRSMCEDAEELKKDLMNQNQVKGGLMFKVKSDPRVTKVGKFLRKTSLDELPQFFNVLKGDMSLVGTRPPTTDEVLLYETHHHRRISIKPGITGMWQVCGRSEIKDFDDVVRLDTKYIDEWSIWMDIKILFKTILVVFKKKGAM